LTPELTVHVPGITGLISSDRANLRKVETMLLPMCTGMAETTGRYENSVLSLAAGWVEGIRTRGLLPAWNEDHTIGVIFSGAEFAAAAKSDYLRKRGHQIEDFQAGMLPHLYEEMGAPCLKTLNGWFCGIILDLRRDEIILFNDRYGLGRLYYCETADGFYFSSQAKSLLAVLPQLREIDHRALAETLTCGCVLQDRTLYPGMFILPGGSMWRWAASGPVRKERYFRKEHWEAQDSLTEPEFSQRLKETFTTTLPKYLRSEETIGMSLTGGIDGRMIMAWAHCAPGTLPCYTFSGPYRECSDATIARRVAQITRQSHEIISIGDDFLDDFPSLAEQAIYISDGTMDVSGSVELYANRLARGIASVRLTGNYGSEIVRGKVAFKPRPIFEDLFDPEIGTFAQATFSTYSEERVGHPVSFIAFKQVPWHHYGRLCLEQSQLDVRTPYLDNEVVSLMYRAPRGVVESDLPCLQLIADGNPALARVPTELGVVLRSNLAGALNRCYQGFTVRAEYAYDYGMPPSLARLDHALESLHLERLFLGRHKFYHFRVWYRDRLADYVRDVLLDQRALSRPYLNRDRVEEVVAAHLAGRENRTLEIHRLLTCELIHRQLLERNWSQK
jgi:asparagine synthase (glutamine-hydrolysing)